MLNKDKINMTETLDKPHYESPVLSKSGLQKEVNISDIGEDTPWEISDGSQAFELGMTVDKDESNSTATSGKLELSTNNLDDRVLFLRVPTDLDTHRIFRVGCDASGMTWLNEVAKDETGKWSNSNDTRIVIANSGEETSIGRADDTGANLHIDGPAVSRIHFKITGEKGGKLIIESGATNGVEVIAGREKSYDPVQSVKRAESVAEQESVNQAVYKQEEAIGQAQELVAAAEAVEPDMSAVATEAWGMSVRAQHKDELSTGKKIDDAAEAANAARRLLIEKGIADLKDGKVNTVLVKVPEEIKPEPEQKTETDKSPEDKMRDACSSAEQLMRSLSDSETPPELKRAVQELVKAKRESGLADATTRVWDEEVVPLIKKIGGEQAQEVEVAIRSTIGNVEVQNNIMIHVEKKLEAAARDGSPDYMMDLLSKTINSCDQMSDEMRNGTLKEQIAATLNDQRSSAFRTLMSSEEVAGVKSKLESRLFDPVELDELQSLYDVHGNAQLA
jgi:hypothetical protein